jgi:hypothetical protein
MPETGKAEDNKHESQYAEHKSEDNQFLHIYLKNRTSRCSVFSMKNTQLWARKKPASHETGAKGG